MKKFTTILLEQKTNILNILYLHGIGGSINDFDILKSNKIKLICRKLNFEDKNLLFNILKDIDKYDGVIGNSVGGLLAYYISNIKNIPSLLFNAAFEDPDIKFEIPILKKFNKNQIAVIGLQDDEILAETQIKNLKQSDCKIYIENIGHDISDDIKIKYFDIFLEKFNN